MISTNCAGDMVPKNLINNIANKLMKQLTHDVSSRETNSTIPELSLINNALLKLANQHNQSIIFDEFYEDYTAQSPVHQGIDQVSTAGSSFIMVCLEELLLQAVKDLVQVIYTPFWYITCTALPWLWSSHYCTYFLFFFLLIYFWFILSCRSSWKASEYWTLA